MEQQILGDIETLEFTDAQIAFVQRAKNSYIEQVTKPGPEEIPERTMGVLHVLDQINEDNFSTMKTKPSCKQGCSHCCHIQVNMTEWEGKTILDYMKMTGREFDQEDIEKFKRQALLKDDKEYIMSPERKCVFLHNNQCSIYVARPAACRNYYVFNDPKDCDTYDGQNEDGRTLVHFDINTIPPIMALMEISEHNSMSRTMLKLLDNATV